MVESVAGFMVVIVVVMIVGRKKKEQEVSSELAKWLLIRKRLNVASEGYKIQSVVADTHIAVLNAKKKKFPHKKLKMIRQALCGAEKCLNSLSSFERIITDPISGCAINVSNGVFEFSIKHPQKGVVCIRVAGNWVNPYEKRGRIYVYAESYGSRYFMIRTSNSKQYDIIAEGEFYRLFCDEDGCIRDLNRVI
ncbi:hypothetical protein ACFL16_01030 [Patescibacteria group bacterium]